MSWALTLLMLAWHAQPLQALGEPGSRTKIGPFTLSGPCLRNDLELAVKRRAPDLRACHGERLSEVPTLAGSVKVAWTIDASGNVAAAAVATPSPDAALDACVLHIIESLRFPPPRQEACSASMVFAFRP